MIDPDDLIAAFLEDDLTESARLELDAWLRSDSSNMRRFTEAVLFDQQIRFAAQAQAERRAAEDFRTEFAPTSGHWFGQWRAVAAAAVIGLAVGLFSTSVVWAYTARKLVTSSLRLANASFEEVEPLDTRESPAMYGRWSGNGSSATASRDVTPLDGTRMMRLVASSPSLAESGAITAHANVFQVLDLREWRAWLADGNAIVNWSASFDGGPERDSKRSIYRVDVRAYTGDVSILRKRGVERLDQEVAHRVSRVVADNAPSLWQTVSGGIIVPPETDFLLVELKLFQSDRDPAADVHGVEHFVDAVHFSLVTHDHHEFKTLDGITP